MPIICDYRATMTKTCDLFYLFHGSLTTSQATLLHLLEARSAHLCRRLSFIWRPSCNSCPKHSWIHFKFVGLSITWTFTHRAKCPESRVESSVLCSSHCVALKNLGCHGLRQKHTHTHTPTSMQLLGCVSANNVTLLPLVSPAYHFGT